MIGLDTNVLVRFIMQDDPRQSAVANRLIESLSAEAAGYVPLVAVVELVWVLSSVYSLERQQLAEVIERLLRSKEIIVDRAETVWKALRLFQSARGDFSDCLIERLAASAGCDKTITFDRAAVKSCGMVLLG